jgi:hypothetical protein
MTQIKILERYDQTKQVTAWGEVWTVPEGTEHLVPVMNINLLIVAKVPRENNRTEYLTVGKVDSELFTEISSVYVGDQ